MPDMDSSEVKILARRLELAPKLVMPALLPVAHRAGNKLKSVLRSDAAGHRGMPGVVGGISYRVSTEATVTINGALTSLWENNLVAVLAEAEYGFVLADEDAEDFVAYEFESQSS